MKIENSRLCLIKLLTELKKSNCFKRLHNSGPSSDEATGKLDEVLKDAEIITRFSPMVCIRLETGSSTCSQFAAIYPVIIVPSVYFIGDVTQ